MPKPIGTILPTRDSLATNEAYAESCKRKRAQVEAAHLAHLPVQVVGGENHFWDGERFYAVVSLRDGQIRWFERREDGDYFWCFGAKRTAMRQK